MKELGHRIREARMVAGISQGKFAEMIGMSRPTLSVLERGRGRTCRHDTLFAASRVLSIPLSYFAEEDAKKAQELLILSSVLRGLTHDKRKLWLELGKALAEPIQELE
jgi:transcriptional regulator with XRE-family HTH domain